MSLDMNTKENWEWFKPLNIPYEHVEINGRPLSLMTGTPDLTVQTRYLYMVIRLLVRGGKLDFGVEWENLCNQPISSPMYP